MAEKVAVVGSRKGADLEHVERFMRALWAKQPDSVLISGGAAGVDKTAETTWMELGGEVVSYRPKKRDEERYVIEKWVAGGGQFHSVSELIGHPSMANYASACWYRDMLIAEEADRVVALYRPGRSRGTGFTVQVAREAEEKPTYEFEANESFDT